VDRKGGEVMKNYLTERKMVLGLHHNMGHLLNMEEEIVGAYPKILFYKATSYWEGLQLLLSFTFDLVVSEMRREQDADLIDLAMRKKFPVLILSEKGHSAESVQNIYGLKAELVLQMGNMEKLVQEMEKTLKIKHKFNLGNVLGKMPTVFKLVVCKLTPQEGPKKYQTLSDYLFFY
jgi:hypothetical protein